MSAHSCILLASCAAGLAALQWYTACSPGVLAAVDAAVESLIKLGAAIVDISIPELNYVQVSPEWCRQWLSQHTVKGNTCTVSSLDWLQWCPQAGLWTYSLWVGASTEQPPTCETWCSGQGAAFFVCPALRLDPFEQTL